MTPSLITPAETRRPALAPSPAPGRAPNSVAGVEPLLSVRLRAGYARSVILQDAQFSLAPGEALGLIGTSGAGKSTLVLALLGLLGWRGGTATGEVLFEGRNLLTLRERALRSLRGARFALIPQSPLSALNSALTLRAHFDQAWKAHERGGRDRLTSRMAELLDQVQLPGDREFLDRKPGQISVGQAQRVLIALGLLHRPSLLIADEPTSALDPATQVEILRLLRRVNREQGTALLYISHDLLSVLQLCSRVAVLDHGRIAECLPVVHIGEATHPTTRSLLSALPVPYHVLQQYGLLE